MKQLSELRVAIVHDWLVGGGAEQVVYELHKMFPNAPIYTSYCSDELRAKFNGKVVTGVLQPLAPVRKYIPYLRAWWFSQLNFDDYDLVISSSGAEAKGIRVKKPTIHVNYCHAPTHYYWSRYEEYMKNPGFGAFDPLARLGLKILVGPMRRWDLRAAKRPDYMIANSTYTAEQIKKYYGREATVIHPPVDVEKFQLPTTNYQLPARKGFIITGRQTPYKRFDLAVAACSQLNLPLIVTGEGPDHAKLKKLAGPSVVFKGWLSQSEVADCLQTAEAFIFPGTDDFGISAVEALAAGTPVIAYQAGGALDYVIPGKTGQFFKDQTVASLADCLKSFDSANYSADDIKKASESFSQDVFVNSMRKELTRILQ